MKEVFERHPKLGSIPDRRKLREKRPVKGVRDEDKADFMGFVIVATAIVLGFAGYIIG